MIRFEDKSLRPMLIGAHSGPFDDEDCIFELKWDGERCLAYLDPAAKTVELINKRQLRLLPKVPELSRLYEQTEERCILDGELVVVKNGRPDYYEIQKRSLMSNTFKISLQAGQQPASFIAFDILFRQDKDLTGLPLMERKKVLEQAVGYETERMARSRYVQGSGSAFYDLAAKQELEGVVGKKKDSIYVPGKRTKDWIKIKNLKDDDFVVCGYLYKENNVISIVLGQYADGRLVYKGHVTMGVGGEPFRRIQAEPELAEPLFPAPPGNEEAVWLVPELVCTVKFMEYTPSGGLRQPVFKGLRPDKRPEECVTEPYVTKPQGSD